MRSNSTDVHGSGGDVDTGSFRPAPVNNSLRLAKGAGYPIWIAHLHASADANVCFDVVHQRSSGSGTNRSIATVFRRDFYAHH
jgi:hypothetical protein